MAMIDGAFKSVRLGRGPALTTLNLYRQHYYPYPYFLKPKNKDSFTPSMTQLISLSTKEIADQVSFESTFDSISSQMLWSEHHNRNQDTLNELEREIALTADQTDQQELLIDNEKYRMDYQAKIQHEQKQLGYIYIYFADYLSYFVIVSA